MFDSDGILENPEPMVELFCESVNIPFIKSALRWEPGSDTGKYSWWDDGSFHENLRNSSGLKKQKRKYKEVSDCSERVRQVYRRMKPHYEKLYAHRITTS